MPVYTTNPASTARFAPTFPAIDPNRNENGIPTNCTSRIAAISAPLASPISVPNAAAMRMMVPIPSL